MKELIEAIVADLDVEAVALVTICSRQGSAPRTAGAKMLVRRDGSIAGTVGGGLVEAEAVALARELLAEPDEAPDGAGRACFFSCDLTGELGEGADLICGGKLELLIEVLSPERRPLYEALSAALAVGRQGLVLTALTITGEPLAGRAGPRTPARVTARHLIVGDAHQGDPCPLDEGELRSLRRARFPRLLERPAEQARAETAGRERRLLLAEPCFVPGTLYIYGAGHVSQPVATIAKLVGFRVEVFDDRPEFASAARFPTADAVRVLGSFDGALEGLALDGDSYLVIVTRGHSHDRTVLAQALGSKAGYVGMIGSRRKRDALFAALRQEGVDDELLLRVRCPIGLPIAAETPEEIGVSIVAELVADRAKRKQ